MTPEDLRSFLTVTHSPTLTAAADQLGVPQPTLTRRIRRVEKHFKAELFERSGAGLVLNARGKAAAEYILQALEKLDDASVEVSRLMDPERGTVRLDFMHSLGTWMVPDLLRTYRDDYPHVEFVLHQGPGAELVERVRADKCDVALVGPRPKEDPDLGWLQLATQPLAVALPAAHELADDAPIHLREVAGEPWVGMLPGYGTRTLLDDLVRAEGFTPNFVFQSMELATVAGLVSAGLGVALLPLNDPYLQVSGICLRPIDPPAHRELGMVWRKGASAAPPVDQFREFVSRSGDRFS